MMGGTWAKFRTFRAEDAKLLSRGATLAGAYFVTLVVVLASYRFMAVSLPGDVAQSVLGYYVICGIVSGIDPGSAKASMIDLPQGTRPDRRGMIGATAIKAIAMAPFFAAVWLYTSSAAFELRDIAIWTPALTVVGFVTTNYRTLLDFEGRYAAAIWLKQGSLSIAIAGVVLAVAAGASLFFALLVTTGLRVLWIVLFVKLYPEPPRERGSAIRQVAAWLSVSGWLPIAALSVLASIGGSIDRAVVLRYVDAEATSAYFMVYEVLSKFWLFSYVLAPIVFATRVRGEGGRVLHRSMAFVAVLGMLFVAGTWIAFTDRFAELTGVRFAFEGNYATIVALAFALNALSQVLTADLQARGRSRALVGLSLALLPLTYVVFVELTERYGLGGISLAWLLRAATELALLAGIARISRPRPPAPADAPVASAESAGIR